jgi:hypothetical protein
MLNGTNGTAVPPNGTTHGTVAQLAERLGIITRAVRKRIAAGQLVAERTAHGWAIALPPTESTTELAEPLAERGELCPAPAELPAEPAAPKTELAEPSGELTALRAQVAWLQAEIERRDTAEAELRRLLAAALQQRALPGPTSPQVDPELRSESDHASRPWWAALLWWRR